MMAVLENELARLSTFTKWPTQTGILSITLAKNGFYYTGVDDRVTCYACGGQLDHWSKQDDLVERHRQESPGCPIVNSVKNTSLDQNGVTKTDHRRFAATTAAAAATGQLPMGKVSPQLMKLFESAASRSNRRTHSVETRLDRTVVNFEALHNEDLRLSTFHDWPIKGPPFPRDLAQQGFYYTGRDDRVQCVFCRGLVINWKSTDSPSIEHKKHYPGCPFVCGRDVGNIPIEAKVSNELRGNLQDNFTRQRPNDISNHLVSEATALNTNHSIGVVPLVAFHQPPSKFPQYDELTQRIDSFRQGQVPRGHSARTIAEAGFFYIGPEDKVQCFQCGGNLRQWEPDDDPWVEHERWYKDCPYLKTRRPVRNPQTSTQRRFEVEPREVKARMDTAMVRAILNMGYPANMIKTAIEKKLATTGDDFANAESLLEALFQLEDASGTEAGASAIEIKHTDQRDNISPPERANTATNHRASLIASSGNSCASSSTSPSRSPPLRSESIHSADSILRPPSPVENTSQPPTALSESPLGLNLIATAAAAAAATADPESTIDSQSKSKGKRRRNKKKPSASVNKTTATTTIVNDDQPPQNSIRDGNLENGIASFEELRLEEMHDEETIQYMEENSRLREARTCKVCMDAEVNTVFLPCGHLVCCAGCSPKLKDCPICRTLIRGTVKTFLS